MLIQYGEQDCEPRRLYYYLEDESELGYRVNRKNHIIIFKINFGRNKKKYIFH